MITLHEFSSLETPLLMGFLAAVFHVWTGPDHLAAVTPLVFDTQKKHWQIGAFWGVGHLIGMLLIGFLFYLFKDYIPVAKISEHSEQLVGIILIGLGIWAFYRIKHHELHHTHPHKHNDPTQTKIHVHLHDHKNNTHEHTHENETLQNQWAATGVGIVHGFAGISHFLLMLPALAFHTSWQSAQYLIGFAIGTIMAMVIFSYIIGKFHKVKQLNHQSTIFQNLRFWGGSIAILVGIFWIVKNYF